MRPLGSWGREGLETIRAGAAAPTYSFTLVELRLNKHGRGNGKMSLAARVTADIDAQTVTLENYAAVPVLIEDISPISTSPW